MRSSYVYGHWELGLLHTFMFLSVGTSEPKC
jgi:hypothetical protein